MKISITGPGDISKITRNTGLSEKEIEGLIKGLGRIIAEKGHELVIIPSRGISAEIAKAYKEAGGKKVYGIVPARDKKFGTDHIQEFLPLIDEKIEKENWYEVASELVPSGDICIVIGMSAGVIRGIGALTFYRKFLNNNTKVIWFKNTISSELPKEINEDIPIRYINSIEELEKIL